MCEHRQGCSIRIRQARHHAAMALSQMAECASATLQAYLSRANERQTGSIAARSSSRRAYHDTPGVVRGATTRGSAGQFRGDRDRHVFSNPYNPGYVSRCRGLSSLPHCPALESSGAAKVGVSDAVVTA
ncbi:hypothetical protein DOTSEDRAFT_75342 [Dothistroma septosporum NZE10]|uniref:Uncharacterized protein n=1 Tax=Dothistroma septosporum (strain NZE10 / CBS 128990) TaxID=675120 RepID=M2YLB4_DOTSN|nr:hypothetical protein DOTSEDRAFT_75342 [Dothistroma septosporum NZE10]